MKQFFALIAAAAFVCMPFTANGQFKLDMKKKVLTIDAKKEVKKETQTIQSPGEINTLNIAQSDGMGETKPVAANDTPGNKAMNRRVEFIKL